ncbi:hypothetical protein BDB00DRAFT_185407 [Zychaea mexicana]|uniref:uncharacterized protein n=1 Tax=Zychaea mexicana TaxID=64656 RepID=UPI0022FF39DD|nr:uncharacterized protein BDB00DRAFT_185407 [Zychaea mexicana]KAI9479503.1 hypothetical protein BDB00DRAFT_185407 [Zychaea mexicana]
MGTIGHGPSKSTCNNCYSIQISQTTDVEPFTIKVNGRQEYQGILLQVKNADNQTVGEFINFNEDEYAPVACEEEVPEEQSVDWAGSIGHVDAKLKSWPIELSWTSARDDVYNSMSNVFRVQGMVVMDYDNYHLLPEFSFTIKKRRHIDRPVAPSPPTAADSTIAADTMITTTIDGTLSEATLIPPDHQAQLEQDPEPNALFMQVLCCILAVYFIMTVARRRWYMRHMPAADPEALKEG